MDGGDHLEDVAPYEQRNVERQNERNGGVLGLPREGLLQSHPSLLHQCSCTWHPKDYICHQVVSLSSPQVM